MYRLLVLSLMFIQLVYADDDLIEYSQDLRGEKLCDKLINNFLPTLQQKLDVYYFYHERKVWLVNGHMLAFEVNLDQRSKSSFINNSTMLETLLDKCYPDYSTLLAVSKNMSSSEGQYLYYFGSLGSCERYFKTNYTDMINGNITSDCFNEPFNRTGQVTYLKLFPGYITTSTVDAFWSVFINNDVAVRHLLRFNPNRLVYTGDQVEVSTKIYNNTWNNCVSCFTEMDNPTSLPVGEEYTLFDKEIFFLFKDDQAMQIMSATFESEIPISFQVVTGHLNYYYHGWVDDRNGKLYFINDTIEVIEIDAQVLEVHMIPFSFTRTPIEKFAANCEPRPPPPAPFKKIPNSIWVALAIITFGLIVGGVFIYYEYNKPKALPDTNWMTAEVSQAAIQTPKSPSLKQIKKRKNKNVT